MTNHPTVGTGSAVEHRVRKRSRNFHRALCLLVACIPLFLIGPGAVMAQEFNFDRPVEMTIEVTDDDPYDIVSGTVSGVDPDQVWAVVFVRTNQWYIQPYDDERAYLPVNPDGIYETWIRDWR